MSEATARRRREGGLRVPLRARLLAAFVAVVMSGGLIAYVLVDRSVQRSARAAFEDRLSFEVTMLGQMTASALFGDLDPTDTSLHAPVRALGEAVSTQLSVIARSGAVVADSTVDDPRTVPSARDSPEIVAARTRGAGVAVRDGRLYVARPIVRDGTTLGYARASVPLTEVVAQVTAVRIRIAWASAVALGSALALGLLLSSRIVRPVQQLSEGARRVGSGDFEHTIEVSSRDEIGDLAGSFNEMTASLRRTMQVLDRRNEDMRLVLDNVDQGLLALDREGVVSLERSAAVDRWLGPILPGARFWEVLGRFDATAGETFELQWQQLLDGMLPLELNVDQLPKSAVHGDRHLALTYLPLVGDDGELSKLLVMVDDVTAQLAAERAEAEQREVACIFEHMMRDKQGVLEFVVDAESQVRRITGASRPALLELRQCLHTLKGNAAVYGMLRLSTLCHDVETRMEDGDVSPSDREALRADWSRMAERLSTFVGDARQVVIDDEEYEGLVRALFDGTPRHILARMVRDWRMERASDRLARFAASARELARRLHKGELSVEVSAPHLRLPRERWRWFWGTFAHVVRNAVDHGFPSRIESRRATLTGRPSSRPTPPPLLRLHAYERSGEIVVEASDNGRGIDWERVAERAKRLGMPWERRADLVEALFVDGLSTRDQVTLVSGRGVGLGAAREACERMGGRVEVLSERGRGTTFRFHVPVEARLSSLPPPRDSLVHAGP